MSCNCTGTSDLSLMNDVLDHYKNIPGSLITVLQNAQELYGFLPQDVIRHIAAQMCIPPAKVFGVATFYTQFRFEPIGKYLILLCQGTACHVNSSKRIEQAINEELNIFDGETTEDGLFTLKNVACLGCCSLSPVMMINDDTFGNLTPDKTKKILKEIREAQA
ncbi:MAG: NADH-quinone oxidoreductase subunit NuoE [Eubacteriales bacterium]